MENVQAGAEAELKEGLDEGAEDGAPHQTVLDSPGEPETAVASEEESREEEKEQQHGEQEPGRHEDA